MKHPSRRGFLRQSSFGLAAAGMGALTLRRGATPSPQSGGLPEDLAGDLPDDLIPQQPQDRKLVPTEDNIQGPFYRRGAPFRGKVTPPMEPGKLLLIRGRVWADDTRKPLAGAILDIWQANAKGRYDNDDPRKPPKRGVYINRARLITDERGYYEYETILPGRYKNGDTFRPAHIHYMVAARGYRRLVTQLYFKGDPFNDTDPFIKKSLIIDLEQVASNGAGFRRGTFDIVLTRHG